MLSYQHGYHAGNLADVHKHSLLCWALDYLVQKDKPLTYIETHAGRGLYDLAADEALKTGEAAQGIVRLLPLLPPAHPFPRALAAVRARHGASAYPGSPLLAALALRDGDRMHLAELHPREFAALDQTLAPWGAHLRAADGFAMALAVCPPTPRRGLLLVDPSYEVKADYETIPRALAAVAKKWNVGVLMLWYPLLAAAPHAPMLALLKASFPDGWRHEVRFPPARPGHGMAGSGLFVVNPPYGMVAEGARISAVFSAL